MIRCVAGAHSTREGTRVVRNLMRRYNIRRDDCDSAVACVLRTRRPLLRTKIHPEKSPGADPVVALHSQLAICSALIVPINTPGGVVGALSLCYSESRRRHAARDIEAATRLAERISELLSAKPATRERVRTNTPVASRPASRH